ncbi:hypothetical protein GGS20DRAFT_585934 [Poronia punctata]|nr:hypothetical protein GGS20DRAFT_585934 [Poronia punctata]
MSAPPGSPAALLAALPECGVSFPLHQSCSSPFVPVSHLRSLFPLFNFYFEAHADVSLCLAQLPRRGHKDSFELQSHGPGLFFTLCGIVPEYDGTNARVIYTFVSIASVLVALRFVARLLKRVPLWWDDYSALVAVLIAIAFTVLCGVFDSLGVGYDIWVVDQDNLSPILILFWAALLCYASSRFFIRLSISLFLMRIFRVPGAQPLIITTLALNAAITVTYVFCIIFQCTPVSFFWNEWDGMHDGFCVDRWAIFLTGGIIATSLDVILILLPVRWVYQLQFSRANKLTTVGMFSLGVIVIVTSIMRIVSLYRFTHSSNLTRNLPALAIWGGLELYVAIICASLPSLRPLLTLSLTRIKAWTTGGSRSTGFSALGPSDHRAQAGGQKKLLSDETYSLHYVEGDKATPG